MRPWSWVLLLVMLALVRATVELAAADNEGSEDAPRQVVPAASLGELVRLGDELPPPAPAARMFQQRSRALCLHMRREKALRRLAQSPKVTRQMHLRIRRYNNESVAVRQTEVIDVAARKHVKVKGKGAYKRWTPGALQRLCWGRGSTLSRRGSSSMSSGSSSILADFFEAAHSHVRKVRAAVAHTVVAFERLALSTLFPAAHGVWTVSFDETDMVLCVEQLRGTHHLQMIHSTLLWRRLVAERSLVCDLVCAPAVLQCTTAAAMVAALDARCPITFGELAAKAGKLLLVLSTDSANACKTVGRHFVAKAERLRATAESGRLTFVLHAYCLMHQVNLCVSRGCCNPFFL